MQCHEREGLPVRLHVYALLFLTTVGSVENSPDCRGAVLANGDKMGKRESVVPISRILGCRQSILLVHDTKYGADDNNSR